MLWIQCFKYMDDLKGPRVLKLIITIIKKKKQTGKGGAPG